MNSRKWFTSDTHYHHANIVRGTTQWTSDVRCREFATLEEHDKKLVDNINACVGEDDTLYHLGDWSFGGFERIAEFRNAIKCKNIHLILGNHDHMIRKDHEGVAELFSSVQPYLEVKAAVPDGKGAHRKYKIIMCHFAMRVWNKSHRGAWMLYGHSHGTLDEMRPEFTNPTWIGDDYYIKNYRTMDVGIDTHPEFRPYSLEELEVIMLNRDMHLDIDQHKPDKT